MLQLKQQLHQQEAQTKKAEEDLRKSQQTIELLKRQLNEIQSNIQQKELEIADIRKKSKSATDELNKEKEKEQTTQKLLFLEKEKRSEKEQQAKTLTEQSAKLSSDLERERERVKDHSRTIEKLTHENKRNEEELKQLNTENDSLKAQLESMKKGYEVAVKKLEDAQKREAQTKEEKVRELEKKVYALEKEKEELKVEVNVTKVELETERKKHNKLLNSDGSHTPVVQKNSAYDGSMKKKDKNIDNTEKGDTEEVNKPKRKTSKATKVVSTEYENMDTDLLLNQIESDNVTAKNADYILETPTKSKGYTIAFSGFKEQHPKFSMEFRNHLQTIITKLGGQVHESKDFEDEQILNADITQITHIVVPSLETRTMKTLAAILSQRWLITTDWVMASNTANHFVDEKKYGFKLSEYLFVDKKFYITPKFTQANESNFQAKNCVDLIGYGKGKLVLRSTDKRDFTIIADDETSAFKGTKAMMTFNDLLNLIPQPPNATGISNGFVEPLIRSKKATDEEKENKLVTPDTDGKKNSRRKSAPYNTPKNKTSNLDSEATEEYQKSSSKKKRYQKRI